MALFERHQLQKDGDSYTVILYLDSSMTEFADEIGNNNDGAKEKLESSVKSYIREKFPNLRVKVAKVMLGGMMVASIPIGAMTAAAAEADVTPISAPVYTTQAQLPDVQGTKYETYVNNLSTLGVIAGKDDGKYHAEDQLSRAEFAKFVVYAAGYGPEAEALVNPTTGFSDVSRDHWAAKYIKMARDKGLMTGTGYNQFNPSGNITYEEIVTVLLRLQGYNDEYLSGAWPTNFVNLAKQTGITQNSEFTQGKAATRGEMALILHNALLQPTVTYNSATQQFESNGEESTVFNRVFGGQFLMENGKVVEIDQAPISMTETFASSSKSITITFNKPVKNATDATFTVTRNGINVQMTPKWSDDLRTVELSSAAKLLAGEYSVKMSGIEGVGTDTGKVAVEAERISSIEIAGEKMVQNKTDKSKATMTYKVFNQYGENVTKDPIARNIQWTSSVAGTIDDGNNGVLTLDADRNLIVDEKIVVTGIDSTTGTVVTKTLTVGEMATITSFQFGDLIYPEGVTRIYTGETEAVRIPFSAIDQYGNTVTDLDQLNTSIQLLDNVDNNRFDFVQANDGGIDIVFNTTAITTNQKVVLTVVSSATGATQNMTFDVVKPAAPAALDLQSVSTLIAANDPAGSLVIPLIVTDQFGNQLTADQIAANASKFSISATGALQNAGLQIATSGPNKGKIVNANAIPSTNLGQAVVVVTIPETGQSDNINLSVREARVLSDIIAPAKVTNNIMTGAEYNFGFEFRDQYGETMTTPVNNANLSYKIQIERVSGDEDALTFTAGSTPLANNATSEDETILKNITVKAVEGKSGSARIIAQLVDSSNNVVSQAVVTFNNVVATGALTYEVTGIPDVIYGGSGASATSAYAIPVSITAKDAQGKEYVVNPKDIVSVGSTHPGLKYDNGKIYGSLGASDANSVKATLVVNFNTKDEVKSITKEVTISKEAAVFESFTVYDQWYTDAGGDVSTDLYSSVIDGATKLTTLTGTVTGTTATLDGYLVGQNQYGVYQLGDSTPSTGNIASIAVKNLVGIEPNTTGEVTASVANGVITLDNVKLTGTGDHTARLIITSDTGKVTYYTVNLEAGV